MNFFNIPLTLQSNCLALYIPVNQGVWYFFVMLTKCEQSLSLQFDNAQSRESQSGKFTLAPAGLEDERALGWHGSVGGGRGGALSSLSCLACCGWVRPTSAVHFAPAASCSGVQSWSVCSWITSFPFAHSINPHQPSWKPSPEHAYSSLGWL